MTAIWNEAVAGTPLRRAALPRRPGPIAALAETLRQAMFRHGNLNDWRSFCRFASRDPHCRGEQNGPDYPDWTATLAHVIQPHVLDRLFHAHQRAQAQAQRDALLPPEPVLPDWFVPGAGSLLWQEVLRTPGGRAMFQALADRCTCSIPTKRRPAPLQGAAIAIPAPMGRRSRMTDRGSSRGRAARARTREPARAAR